MSTAADQTAAAAQKAESIKQIANVSRLLRDAISASIPVAPEQYMTVTIPGTSIDTRDITNGGTYVYGKEYSAFVPPQVRQAEARLVDGMMPLAYVSVGNTGKSVSRSYSRALDVLVAKKATLKTGESEIRSPGNADYDKAMDYLTKPVGDTGLTPVDVYIEKQSAWAESQATWDKAKQKIEATAKAKFPTDLVQQRKYYDDWAQANYRRYKFAVQGRYMDWVSNGHKYEVEQNFGVVDVDSIMARIEQSKESLRNSSIVDTDGANELAGVILEPKDWATKCQGKSNGWYKRNQSFSVAQLETEINRLTRLKISYEALKTSITDNKYPVGGNTAPTPTEGVNVTNLTSKFAALYEAQGKLNHQTSLVAAKTTPQAKDEERKGNEYQSALTALKTARLNLAAQVEADQKSHSDWTKYNTASLTGMKMSLAEIFEPSGLQANDISEENRTKYTQYLDGQITTIDSQLTKLADVKREREGATPIKIPVITGAESDEKSNGTAYANDGDEKALAIFTKTPAAEGTSAPGGDDSSNPWTTISASFSAEDQQSKETTSSWGMSVGGGAGWGLWSVGGSYSHDQSKSDSVSDMSKCSVHVTFDALVVNVNRPWLYGELFSDSELDTASTDIKLSPGAEKLRKWMETQKAAGDATTSVASVVSELAKYSQFPAYPTSFIIAADTEIEFEGDTQHIENHFSSHSNSGSVSVGWGPFSVSSSFHESASSRQFQMESTATGCRLKFGAPQIIGWVSQILPELPRNPNYVPMVQNVVA